MKRRVLLEVGPGKALSTLALQSAAKLGKRMVATSLPDASREIADQASMLDALGRLWIAGIKPDWRALHGGASRRRVSLPTYPFERQRYWVDAPKPKANQTNASTQEIAMDAAAIDHVSAPDVTTGPRDGRDAKARAMIVAMLEDLSGESLEAADPTTTFLEMGFELAVSGPGQPAVADRLRSQRHVSSIAQRISDDPVARVAYRHVPAAGTRDASFAAGGTDHRRAAARDPRGCRQSGGPDAPTACRADVRDAGGNGSRGHHQGSASGYVATDDPAARSAAEPSERSRRGGAGADIPPGHVIAHTPDAASAAGGGGFRFEIHKVNVSSAATDITPAQRRHIDELIASYTSRTAGSKQYTQTYRAVLATRGPRQAFGRNGRRWCIRSSPNGRRAPKSGTLMATNISIW